MNKYHNKKTTLDGVVFDSRAEARRWAELQILEKAGKISGLIQQPEYTLQDGFTHDGKKELPIKYRGDFEYKDHTGQIITEDVKGFKTEVFRIKRKLFLAKFGKTHKLLITK